MRSKGRAGELEYRRLLAVRRLQAGYTAATVAAFLEVAPVTVRRWWRTFRHQGAQAVAVRPVARRPPKLSRTQEKIVRRWLEAPAHEQGFGTELWSGGRLAALIGQEFGVRFHPSYLSAWRRAHGYTPQTPARGPRYRDPLAIDRGLERDWPSIKKTPAARGPVSCSSTKADS